MLEKNKIYFGDCLDIMTLIDDRSIDMICCDLPYGLTANPKDKIIPIEPLWEQYKRIIKDNGCIALFAQGIFAAKLISSNEKMFKYDLIWKKGERISGFLNSKRQPLRNHEQILIFYKKQPVYNPIFTEGNPLHGRGKSYMTKDGKNRNYGDFNTKLLDTRKGSTQKYPKSVLNFEKPFPSIHPTQKPINLCEWLIKTYTNENETILDNACGVGTTCSAAKNSHRDFIGIELDEKWYKIACEKINDELPLR
jgi:site-specific DNA-methyltransferase (adenine-specific)